MNLYKETDLMSGEDNVGGAFDPIAMKAREIDNTLLTGALVTALTPFAPLLREGYGVALIDGKLIGVYKQENKDE